MSFLDKFLHKDSAPQSPDSAASSPAQTEDTMAANQEVSSVAQNDDLMNATPQADAAPGFGAETPAPTGDVGPTLPLSSPTPEAPATAPTDKGGDMPPPTSVA